MERVWKCDFCHHFEVLHEKIVEHENMCDFNPSHKKCYSCEHRYDYYGNYECLKNLKCMFFEKFGNCKEWKTDNEKLIRKLKIKNLNEKSLEM